MYKSHSKFIQFHMNNKLFCYGIVHFPVKRTFFSIDLLLVNYEGIIHLCYVTDHSFRM